MTQIVLPAGIAAASDIIPVVPGPSRTCVCYCSALLTIPNIAAKECDCPDGIHFVNVIHYVVPNSCLQSDDGLLIRLQWDEPAIRMIERGLVDPLFSSL